jgi:ABC-type glycerol-3-phosphate transport system substrate-binding protein
MFIRIGFENQPMKRIYLSILAALALAGCGSMDKTQGTGAAAPKQEKTETLVSVQNDIPSSVQEDASKTITNTYKNIPVEVTGIPYGFKDICGNHTIDYVMDEYTLISTRQSSKFVNFKINRLV